MKRVALLLAVLGVVVAGVSAQAAFVDGQLAVVRVGDGSTAFAGTVQQAVFVDFYDVTTGARVSSSPISGITLPSTQDGHDGHISLSGNGNALTLAGYVAAAGTSGAVASTTVLRAAAALSSSGSASVTPLAAGDYGTQTITAAVSTGDGTFWTVGGNTTAGVGGLRYVSASGVSTNVSRTLTGAAADSFRNARLINGKLYINTASQGSFTNRGSFIMSIGGGLPYPAIVNNSPVATASTATPVITNLEGSFTDANGNPDGDGKGKAHPKSDAVYLDLNGDGTLDTAYGTGGKEDIEKFSLIGGLWVRTDYMALANVAEVNALDVLISGMTLSLFVSTDAGVFRYSEPTAAVTEVPADRFVPQRTLDTSVPFASPGANQFFRGIAVVPEPGVMACVLPAVAVVGRRRR